MRLITELARSLTGLEKVMETQKQTSPVAICKQFLYHGEKTTLFSLVATSTACLLTFVCPEQSAHIQQDQELEEECQQNVKSIDTVAQDCTRR